MGVLPLFRGRGGGFLCNFCFRTVNQKVFSEYLLDLVKVFTGRIFRPSSFMGLLPSFRGVEVGLFV